MFNDLYYALRKADYPQVSSAPAPIYLKLRLFTTPIIIVMTWYEVFGKALDNYLYGIFLSIHITDITSIDGSELAFDRDIKWKFPKVAGQHGLYNTPSTPFGYDDTLVSILNYWVLCTSLPERL